jgi:hypothetical protein
MRYPVTRNLLSQMNWYLAANKSKDLSTEDLIAHANLLSIGEGFSNEGMFINDVSDATCGGRRSAWPSLSASPVHSPAFGRRSRLVVYSPS